MPTHPAPRATAEPGAVVRAYHERTKHRLSGYAAGPETLDWEAQPDPFRRFAGAPVARLPLVADGLDTRWTDLGTPGAVVPRAMHRDCVAGLLELSLALTAWKQSGPDRWALRANPSSGNLHPTEAYVLALGVDGLPDGLHHYQPREHALALRRPGRVVAGPDSGGQGSAGPRLWLGLSSIHWREAWKYGERAFRYCQLDVGHALGSVRYAAAALGWQARAVDGIGHGALAALLGLDRDEDFSAAEREDAELLVQIGHGPGPLGEVPAWFDALPWSGVANRLDPRPMYRWPVIDEVARATRAPAGGAGPTAPPAASARQPCPSPKATPGDPTGLPPGAPLAATLIRQRRSAQRFDRTAQMPLDALARLLAALRPEAGVPWDAWPHAPRVHAVVWAQRVDGLAPGAYLLPRSEDGARALIGAGPAGIAGDPPVPHLAGVALHPCGQHPSLAKVLRQLSCHQAIAGDACLVVSLLAELDLHVPWSYRALLQEAGLIGQALYLQAEAVGLRGTGIGCYFDDAVHDLLTLRDGAWQVLYQFTVGAPVADDRLQTEPPYADRPPVPAGGGLSADRS